MAALVGCVCWLRMTSTLCCHAVSKSLGGNLDRVDLLEQFQHVIKLGHELAVLLVSRAIDALGSLDVLRSLKDGSAVLTLEALVRIQAQNIQLRPFCAATQAYIFLPFLAWRVLSFDCRG